MAVGVVVVTTWVARGVGGVMVGGDDEVVVGWEAVDSGEKLIVVLWHNTLAITFVSGDRGQGFDPHSLQGRRSFSTFDRTGTSLSTLGRGKVNGSLNCCLFVDLARIGFSTTCGPNASVFAVGLGISLSSVMGKSDGVPVFVS
ncbi:hypothetical protein Tco_0985482 [Tanacetum coccineum]